VTVCVGSGLLTSQAWKRPANIATLLPEVFHAVSTGLAGPDALALPGTRALAG